MKNSSKVYNWGIIGPGKIAHKFAEDIELVPNAKLYAVASRSLNRAKEFAEQYNADKYYDSYEELAKDPNVDVIYVATTNNMHYEHALLCLSNKKPCLCEKPFTLNSEQLTILINVAKKADTFLMEALWTKFLPSMDAIAKNLPKIGKLLSSDINFGFKVPYNRNSREYAPELGGGSLLDIGIYPIFLALHLWGEPEWVKASAEFSKDDVDIHNNIEFIYETHTVTLESSFKEDLECEAIFYGENGKLTMHRMWHIPCPISIEIDNKTEDITPEYVGNGYNYEIAHVQECLDKNMKESDVMTFDFSLMLMKYLDKVDILQRM